MSNINFGVTVNLIHRGFALPLSPHGMKLSIIFVVACLFAAVRCMYVPRDYTEDSLYRRRKDSEKVKQKLVEHWSRPDVLRGLPQGMKWRVETYIKKFPEYQWKPGTKHSSDSDSGSAGKRKSEVVCANQ